MLKFYYTTSDAFTISTKRKLQEMVVAHKANEQPRGRAIGVSITERRYTKINSYLITHPIPSRGDLKVFLCTFSNNLFRPRGSGNYTTIH